MPEPKKTAEYKRGCRLHVHFKGEMHPDLDEIEFAWSTTVKGEPWKRVPDDPCSNSPSLDARLPKALAEFFVSFAAWAAGDRSQPFSFREPAQAATIRNARDSEKQHVHKVFIRENKVSCYTSTFTGTGLSRPKVQSNTQGKNSAHRTRIVLWLTSVLPSDCVEVFWDRYGDNPVNDAARLNELLRAFRGHAPVISKPPPSPEARIPHKPFAPSIPPPDGDLKGRLREGERIATVLKTGRHVIVHGMPGLGKTQLALSVANALKQEFPAGQLFVSLQPQAGTVQRPSDVLLAALRILKGLTAELSTDQASLRAAYDNALAGGKWLVIVDNAQTADDTKALKPHSPSALLVTARPKLVLDGADCVRPDLLSPEEAKEFLQALCPRLPNDIAARIAELCGHLPLALRNAGTLLALYEDKDPAQFAVELADERTRLRQLNPDNDLADVEASFNLSYKQLDTETARVFASLAVFPATFGQEAEIAVSRDAGGRKLSHLVRQGLVFFNEKTERYHLHDLLRLFAQSRLGESERDIRIRHAEHFTGVIAQADKMCAVDGEEFREGVKLFEDERANIISAWSWVIEEFKTNRSMASLCSRFAMAGRITGRQLLPEQRITFYETAACAAEVLQQAELRAEYLYDQAHAINDKGQQQEIDLSMQLLRDALVSARDPRLRVLILTQMARNHLRVEPRSNRTKRAALDCHEKAWQIAQRTDDTDLKVRATTRLANSCLANWQQLRAESLYKSALKMVEPSRQRLKAYVLNGYGNFFRVDSYRKRLIPLLEEAREIAAKFESKRDGKDANFKLGMCLLDSDPSTALDCFRTSLEMNQALGDQRGIAGSYRDIGIAHIKLNQRAEAVAPLNAARTLCIEIGWNGGLQEVDKWLEEAGRASG